ncbi:hypothetical protein EJ02DRAFT_508629 [Clathrospora elynae]|uniref:Uncharacterized protein n=1 Tax=Clathrospora elynae TaxID=706981 RepID=A0A6A5TBT8_9PLEO|nr:hypothetical protein EJ02DRAFT_508629 [Clathrospora elynae]
MSENPFNFVSVPTRSPSPSPSRIPLSSAQSKSTDRCVLQSEALIFGICMLKVHVGKGDGFTIFIFFKRAAGSVWQQHEELLKVASTWMQVLEFFLPKDDPEVFRLYLNLVYANQLISKGADEWSKLCRLYVLAEKLQDRTAKNQIIDGIHAFFNELILKNLLSLDTEHVLPAEATVVLYEGTAGRSSVRKLLVDLYADSGNESWLRGGKTQLPEEFVFDVAVRLLQKRTLAVFGSSISRPSFFYHDVSFTANPISQADVKLAKGISTNTNAMETSPEKAEAVLKKETASVQAGIIWPVSDIQAASREPEITLKKPHADETEQASQTLAQLAV